MDALQVERLDALDGFVIGLARHPAKSFVVAAVGQHYIVVLARDARDQGNRGRQIFDFGRHGKRRIHKHGHGQLMTGAVIDDPALSGQRNLALLLVFRLFHKTAVAEDLQVNQPPADRCAPKQKHPP